MDSTAACLPTQRRLNHAVAIPKLAELAARGKLSVDGLITGTRPLSEVNVAMEQLERGSEIRQVLVP